MKFAQTVRFGAWLLISLNLLMAWGSIWVFIRMSPAIEVIIEQNQRSLKACEIMLASLVMVNAEMIDSNPNMAVFNEALEKAKNNITDEEEPLILEKIGQYSAKAFKGDLDARKQTVNLVLHLGELSREAMIQADKKARQFSNAGAWGIVFMATGVFLTGMIFIRNLKRSLLGPLEEIRSVISAHKNGDRLRRCTGINLPRDIKMIFNDLNEFLDQVSLQVKRSDI